MVTDAGPLLGKFRINVPGMRVRGRVLSVGSTTAPPSDMDLLPDQPYLSNLCSPLPAWQLIHCETYTTDGTPYSEAWPTVLDGGARRPVRVGDRISVRGDWVYDNGLHDADEKAAPGTIIDRGLLRAYLPKVELHPYANDDSITLVDDAAPVQEHFACLCAPFYAEVYDGKWWWNRFLGIDMHVVNSTVDPKRLQTWDFAPPPLPAGGIAGTTHRLDVQETVLLREGTSGSNLLTGPEGLRVMLMAEGDQIDAPSRFLGRYVLQWVAL
jgi:hypothetical protein